MSLPVINSAYPNQGLLYGYTSVDISGSNFTGVNNVFFLDANENRYDVSFTILDDTTINLYSTYSPIQQTMHIYATNANGTSSNNNVSFLFTNQSPLYGLQYAMGASGGFFIKEGFPTINLVPLLNKYDVTNALQVTYDVRKFNQLLGLIKDASNQYIVNTEFNPLTDSFPNDTIILNAADFVANMSSNQVISVGAYSTLYSNFDEYVNAYFAYGNITPLFASGVSTDYYDLFKGVFDASSFMHIITEQTPDPITGAYVSDVSGSITIENVNKSILYLVFYNIYGNRNSEGGAYFHPSNQTNYTVADGFIDGDLIFVPDGTNITLTLKIGSETSSYLNYAANNDFSLNNVSTFNQNNYSSKYGEGTYTSCMNMNDVSNGFYYITQTITAPLLIRLENLSSDPNKYGSASTNGM